MGESVSSVFFISESKYDLAMYICTATAFICTNKWLKKTVVARGVEDVGHSAGGGLWQDGGDES